LVAQSHPGFLPAERTRGSYSGYAKALEAIAHVLLRAARSQSSGTSGTVRITASEVIGTEMLPSILA
jgi:DNA-binding transcriptional LysR family regulator